MVCITTDPIADAIANRSKPVTPTPSYPGTQKKRRYSFNLRILNLKPSSSLLLLRLQSHKRFARFSSVSTIRIR
jgi:hypothetical protein